MGQSPRRYHPSRQHGGQVVSTVAEHLAAIELYRAIGLHEVARSEGYLLIEAHLAELIAAQPDMDAGRAGFERIVREQCRADIADARIKRWRDSLAAATPRADNQTTKD